MDRIFSIAIDGTSGVGKSTAAQGVSERLNILYLDTGAMYRAVGLYMLKNGIDPKDEMAVEAALPGVSIAVSHQDGKQHTYLCGEDVTDTIREQEVGLAGSDVSKVLKVRENLVRQQREIAQNQSVVMDGRDIGTHVLKDATLKVFLTAAPEVRAKRRLSELFEKGLSADEADVLSKLNARDHQDMTRTQSPLRMAEDAVEINTENMTREQIVEEIIRGLEARLS